MVVFAYRLDLMISEVFSNLSDFVILQSLSPWECTNHWFVSGISQTWRHTQSFLACTSWKQVHQIMECQETHWPVAPGIYSHSLCRTAPILSHPTVYPFHVRPWRLPFLCIPEYSLEVPLWELGGLRLNSLRLREKLGLWPRTERPFAELSTHVFWKGCPAPGRSLSIYHLCLVFLDKYL